VYLVYLSGSESLEAGDPPFLRKPIGPTKHRNNDILNALYREILVGDQTEEAGGLSLCADIPIVFHVF